MVVFTVGRFETWIVACTHDGKELSTSVPYQLTSTVHRRSSRSSSRADSVLLLYSIQLVDALPTSQSAHCMGAHLSRSLLCMANRLNLSVSSAALAAFFASAFLAFFRWIFVDTGSGVEDGAAAAEADKESETGSIVSWNRWRLTLWFGGYDIPLGL